MIDLNNMTAGLYNEPIKEWAVMFMTPLGISLSLDDAKAVCKHHDMNVNVITPVAVAVTERSYEVVQP